MYFGALCMGADVAGVDDEVGPAQRGEGLRPQQAVRIRDDAHQKIAHRGAGMALYSNRSASIGSRRAALWAG